MTHSLGPMLMGAVAMSSFVAALFFLRFWRQTADRFFLFFAVAFALDGATRVALGLAPPSSEAEPLFYFGRLLMFALIIAAIADKNRHHRS